MTLLTALSTSKIRAPIRRRAMSAQVGAALRHVAFNRVRPGAIVSDMTVHRSVAPQQANG